MCRFLIVKSKNPINPSGFLSDFSQMCQLSKTTEGDWQGDGWGVALKTNLNNKPGKYWLLKKKTTPIWKEKKYFSKLPKTNLFVAHARSASFTNQNGIVEYNQPYIKDKTAFVFNGMIRGVKLNKPVAGKIGAQKIFSLINQELEKDKNLPNALRKIYQTLLNSSKQLRGLNIGLTDGNKIAALCAYQKDKEYFTLYHYSDDNIKIICSQPLGGYKYKQMKNGQIITL